MSRVGDKKVFDRSRSVATGREPSLVDNAIQKAATNDKDGVTSTADARDIKKAVLGAIHQSLNPWNTLESSKAAVNQAFQEADSAAAKASLKSLAYAGPNAAAKRQEDIVFEGPDGARYTGISEQPRQFVDLGLPHNRLRLDHEGHPSYLMSDQRAAKIGETYEGAKIYRLFKKGDDGIWKATESTFNVWHDLQQSFKPTVVKPRGE